MSIRVIVKVSKTACKVSVRGGAHVHYEARQRAKSHAGTMGQLPREGPGREHAILARRHARSIYRPRMSIALFSQG